MTASATADPVEPSQARGVGSVFLPAAIVVLLADQLSKWYLFSLPPGSLPPLLRCARNTGVAWSIGAGSPTLVAIITWLLIPGLIWMWWRHFRRSRAENLAFGLIVGGALGNAIDRTCAQLHWFGLTGVRDFINVDLGVWPFHPFPTFNIADSGITVGFVILLALSLFKPSTIPAAGARPAPDR